jgi:hypothetical protein
MLTCYLSAKIDLAGEIMKNLMIALSLLVAFEAQAVPPKKVCPKSCCTKLVRENFRLRMQLKRYAPPPPAPAGPVVIRSVDDPVEGIVVPVIQFVD